MPCLTLILFPGSPAKVSIRSVSSVGVVLDVFLYSFIDLKLESVGLIQLTMMPSFKVVDAVKLVGLPGLPATATSTLITLV